MMAAQLDSKPGKTQVAILLHCAGPEAQDIFANFQFSNTDDDKSDNIENVITKFRQYCEPKKNVIFETYKFWQRDQHEGEPFDKWVNDLRIILHGCEYGNHKDRHLRDKIVLDIHDKSIDTEGRRSCEIEELKVSGVRERLLRGADLTLAKPKALDICHAAETSKAQMMEKPIQEQHVYNIQRRPQNHTKPRHWENQNLHKKMQHSSCQYCGTEHAARKCPAYGKTCSLCGLRNGHAAETSKAQMMEKIETSGTAPCS
ncbi:LOW QUALITY PROTEIN: uncharacterized protein LOC144750542 [Ciona intestinalis]